MSFNKKITTKEFYNIELINVAEWYAQSRKADKEKFSSLPFQVQLALRTNIKEINKTTESIIEMRNDFAEGLRNKYFVPEKTDEVEHDGQKVMQLKDEFMTEYQTEASEYDKKLQEVLMDRTEVTLSVFDMDAVYETLPDDCKLNMDDIDMLSFMDKVDDEEDENTTEGE